ncbi:hypothetical protein [Umezawaea tangerina]|uniref:Uncharacterized protein n=1 Tax=Umezawaea tangerina TaxID=84725 RepID=A0A2T0TGU6_9PSEU|nr:hypothetical protein [Umezawaea tangerina]PRY44853.1 hypothetical protein CLV43_102418 [Umezawaea tangerina]
MTRRRRLAAALVLVLLCAGLGVWAWYLSGRSLADADSASSVLGGFAAVVFGVAGVAIGLAALRRAEPDDGTPVSGDRAVSVRGSVGGHVVTGDHTTITGWSPRATWVVGLVVAVAAAASVASVVVALRSDGPAPVERVRLGAYTVTVRGSAIGGDPFELQGELRVRAATDGLPYQWCLKVGDPWGSPKPGAIWFGTSGRCFGKRTDQSVAEVRETDGEHVLVPVDPPTPEDQLNAFTATSGELSGAYRPTGGDVRFRASAARLEGTVSLQGLEVVVGLSTRGTVTATFTAALVSDDPDALVSSPLDPAGDSGRPTRPDVPGVRYTVRTVVSFTATTGAPDLRGSARERFAQAVFVVEARDGGRFVYDPPGSRDDLFPVTGTVTGAAPVFVLAGGRTSGEGTLAASSRIGGTFDLSGPEPVVRLTLGTAAFGAESGYQAEAVLAKG